MSAFVVFLPTIIVFSMLFAHLKMREVENAAALGGSNEKPALEEAKGSPEEELYLRIAAAKRMEEHRTKREREDRLRALQEAIHDYPWYTAESLEKIALGHYDPPEEGLSAAKKTRLLALWSKSKIFTSKENSRFYNQEEIALLFLEPHLTPAPVEISPAELQVRLDEHHAIVAELSRRHHFGFDTWIPTFLDVAELWFAHDTFEKRLQCQILFNPDADVGTWIRRAVSMPEPFAYVYAPWVEGKASLQELEEWIFQDLYAMYQCLLLSEDTLTYTPAYLSFSEELHELQYYPGENILGEIRAVLDRHWANVKSLQDKGFKKLRPAYRFRGVQDFLNLLGKS